MKTHFKVLLTLLMASAVACFTSCGLGGPNLADQASVDKYLRKPIANHVDPQSTVFEISLGSTSDLSLLHLRRCRRRGASRVRLPPHQF